MRYALFETGEARYAIALDRVLHILPEPKFFHLPALCETFDRTIVYQEQIVPVVSAGCLKASSSGQQDRAFVLICEAEFGWYGLPADRMERITAIAEDVVVEQEGAGGELTLKMDEKVYRLLEINRILEAPDTAESTPEG